MLTRPTQRQHLKEIRGVFRLTTGWRKSESGLVFNLTHSSVLEPDGPELPRGRRQTGAVMPREQLCPASSKGMDERSLGSAAASGRSVVPAPRAAAGRLQLPFSPGEDPPFCARPPGPPGPEAGRPPLRERPGQPGSRARAAAGLPSRRCGGGSPPGPALQLLAA